MAYSLTDDNVPLKCSECDAYLEGLQETIKHLINFHGDHYTLDEAKAYAESWVELAHDDQREQMADYYEQRKLDRAMGD